MATYNGQLHANKVLASLYNMILSQYVSGKVVEGLFTELRDSAVEEVGLYGDTKLFYLPQLLKSYEWEGDAANLLAVSRPENPYCQAITIDTYRQVMVSLDSYCSKQAWATEGAFTTFHSVMKAQLENTKRVEETGIVNVFVGTTVSPKTAQNKEITVGQGETIGQKLAEEIANLEIELKDLNRLNDLEYARAYNPSDIRIVISSAYANKIKKLEMPAIFHDDAIGELFSKAKVLPAKYFGTVNAATKTSSDANTRVIEECDVGGKHYYPGDKLPTGTTIAASGSITVPTYQEDGNVICKVMMKDSVVMLSAFTVSTSFFNAKSLIDNTFITWGRSEPAYILDKPFITIKKAA